MKGAVHEERFAPGGGDDHRPPALHHAPDDALARLVARAQSVRGEAQRGIYLDIAALRVDEEDRAAHDALGALQLFQRALERGA